MNNLTRFEFNHQEVRFVGTADNPWWIAQDVCNVLGLRNPSKSLSRLDEDEKGYITLSYTTENNKEIDVELLTINESGLYSLILRSRKDSAKKFKKWITSEVLPTIRKTGSYSVESTKTESDRDRLEKQLLPTPDIKQIKEALYLYREVYGEAYSQRYLAQQFSKHYPQLAGESPRAEEMASLPTAKALLTPTQIAEELKWYHGTGNPNPRKVNCMLVQLGYQAKIGGRWSATDKAIQANLCDRKPVDTNSRTQKDQLLWSDKIIDILKEHSLV